MSSERSDVVLRVSDLTVSYPPHGVSDEFTAIAGVGFAVRQGEILGLIGEAGSGKSTLARVISTEFKTRLGQEVRPEITGGEVTVLGTRLRGHVSKRRLAELRFDIGYLPQDAATRLPAEYTVREIISAPVLERDRRYDRRALNTHVASLMDTVHLSLGLLDKYPFELSSGQRQRVAIARTLTLGPTFIVADEPTTGVDVTARAALHDLLERMRDEVGLAAVVISHDLSLLRQVASSVAAIHRGALVGLGDIDTLLAEGTHPFLQALASGGVDAEDGAS